MHDHRTTLSWSIDLEVKAEWLFTTHISSQLFHTLDNNPKSLTPSLPVHAKCLWKQKTSAPNNLLNPRNADTNGGSKRQRVLCLLQLGGIPSSPTMKGLVHKCTVCKYQMFWTERLQTVRFKITNKHIVLPFFFVFFLNMVVIYLHTFYLKASKEKILQVCESVLSLKLSQAKTVWL